MEEKTIRWHRVKCSFFKQEIAVPSNIPHSWDALCNFMRHTVGFDYVITAEYGDIPSDLPQLIYSEHTTQGWDFLTWDIPNNE